MTKLFFLFVWVCHEQTPFPRQIALDSSSFDGVDGGGEGGECRVLGVEF